MNKKLLALILAALMAITMLTACSKKDEPAKTDEPAVTDNADKSEEKTDEESKDDSASEDDGMINGEKIDEDQYINTFMDLWPNTYDPSKGNDTYGNNVLVNVLEPLIRYNEDHYEPAGAESWDISDDGLTYTFHIRKGNKWDDGKEVTAEDYAFGIRRSAMQDTASPYASFIYPLVNGQAVNSGEADIEELGVETPDEYTLVLTLGNPVPFFLDMLLNRVYFPQREDYVEQYGDQYSTDLGNIPMCGPFLIEDMTLNNEINYVRNENFWNAKNVMPDTVHVAILNDTNTINNALMTGEIDYSGVGDPKVREELEQSGEYNVLKRQNPWTGYFMMNYGPDSHVANNKITRAIAAVLDRQEVIDNAWNGTPVPAYAFVSPVMRCQGVEFNKEGEGPAKRLMEDIKDPKALFEEGVKELGGDPAGYVVRLLGSDNSDSGRIAIEAFQQQIEKALGCKVDAQNLDWNAFTNVVESGDFDIAWAGWGADYNDPINLLETVYSKAPAYNIGWVNEKFDSLLEEARLEVDAEKRAELLREAENIMIYEDAVIIPINHGVANIFRKKYLRGAADNWFTTMGLQTLYTVGR